jgi:hypothetical protein
MRATINDSEHPPHHETPHTEIDLEWSPASLRQVLEWGRAPATAPYSHHDIARWCERLHNAHLETDDPPAMEAAVRVAGDVDCQFDLYVASSYTKEERCTLDYSSVRLPTTWFEEWLQELDAI